MNNGPLLFLGVFGALAFSFTGVVLSSHIQYGRLAPYYDQNEGNAFPEPAAGLAERGRRVYQELGCAACHTQQVRRPGFGGDIERGWGERQSFARDYLRETPVLLGNVRFGPDLRNIGARPYTADWHYLHLYDARLVSPGSIMAPFPFLFEYRRVLGEPSPMALKLPLAYVRLRGLDRPGFELVPTRRAEALVAYLMSRKDAYEYPVERQKNSPGGAEQGEHP